MDIYDTVMKPLENNGLARLRKRQVIKAYGHVLELGAGNGANLPFYDFGKIESLTITDVKFSNKLAKLKENNNNSKFAFQETSATNLPFKPQTFDTVLFTLIFCSVDDVAKGLEEIRRVLKDDGHIIFIEHVIAPKNPLKSIMNLINTPWKAIANGCNLNRDFEKSVIESGFKIVESDRFFKGIGFSGVAKK